MIAVPIRYRRAPKAKFIQKLQHAIPSVVVLGDGISHIQHDPHGVSLVLGAAEIVISLIVIGTVVRGFRRLRAAISSTPDHGPAHHGVDWIDISLGGMLAVEACAKYYENGHIARPTILLSVVMFTIGVCHGRIAAWADRRRELHISDEGISVPLRLFHRRVSMTWDHIAAIELDDRHALITATNGRDRRLNFVDMIDPKPVRDALHHAQNRLAALRSPAGEVSPL